MCDVKHERQMRIEETKELSDATRRGRAAGDARVDVAVENITGFPDRIA